MARRPRGGTIALNAQTLPALDALFSPEATVHGNRHAPQGQREADTEKYVFEQLRRSRRWTEHSMNLQQIETFVRVVEAGSSARRRAAGYGPASLESPVRALMQLRENATYPHRPARAAYRYGQVAGSMAMP